MDEDVAGVGELARLLGVDERLLADVLGGRWVRTEADPELGSDVVTFTGRENPRMPERPLVAIRVDRADLHADVGKAVGVPLPSGHHQWALAEPRTRLHISDEPPDEVQAALMLGDLRDAVARVLDAATLKGTSW